MNVLELADSRAEGKTSLDNPLSHCLSLRWFQSHVVVLGVGPQLGQVAVAEARLASRGSGWCVLLLATSGGGLVAVVVTIPVLGCQFVVAPVCVASRPRCVSEGWGGSACGPSTLWRSEVAVFVFMLLWLVRDCYDFSKHPVSFDFKLARNPKPGLNPVRARCRQPDCDRPICRLLGLIATIHLSLSQAIATPFLSFSEYDMTPVAFWPPE
ncbi:hypothetical protein Taro_028892 [Colocasia esculenta]|uniref:Uncharacterized protein n=1 Tax=Colocasia esculenta TaxID=4460 RepID=A0A843VPH2_COLES|nr:hypothetical protein [Colocasia esculenta]